MKTEYKYGQYCTPLSQSDYRYFFRVSDKSIYVSLFFTPTRSFPPDALVPIMIPIGALFLISLELNLSDANQNGLKHQTNTDCFKGSPGT